MARHSRLAAASLGAAALLLAAARLPAQEPDGGPADAPKAAVKKVKPRRQPADDRAAAEALRNMAAEFRTQQDAKKDLESGRRAAADEARIKATIRAIQQQMDGGIEKRKAELEAARALAIQQRMKQGVDDNDPQFLMYAQQLRPLLRAELYLARKVCEPGPDERERLAEAAERGYKEAVKQLVAGQRVPRPVNDPATDPNRIVGDAVAAAVKQCLTPDQATRHAEELARRADQRKHAIAVNLVALFDQHLLLTDEQREQLVADLEREWDPAWCPSLEHVQYGLQYLPVLPDSQVAPRLNAQQRVIWEQIQASTRHVVSFGLGNEADNQELDDAKGEK